MKAKNSLPSYCSPAIGGAFPTATFGSAMREAVLPRNAAHECDDYGG